MPRLFAQNRISMWQDPDFRALSSDAQNLYNYLLAHPTMTYAGVAGWFPKRLAHVNTSWSEGTVETIGWELAAAHFVVIDCDWDEVCVRSFLRHEQVLKVPNLARAAIRAIDRVGSPDLRRVIVHEILRLQDQYPDWAAWQLDELADLIDVEPLDGRTINAPLNAEPNPWVDPSGNPPVNPSPNGPGNGPINPYGNPSANPSAKGSPITSNHEPVTSNPEPGTANLHSSTTAQRAADDEIAAARAHLRGLDLDYDEIRKAIVKASGHIRVGPQVVVRTAVHVLAKPGADPRKPLAYVIGSIKANWHELEPEIAALFMEQAS